MVNEGSYDIERIISEGLRPVRALYWSAIQQIAHQLVQEFPGDVLKLSLIHISEPTRPY